MLACWAALNTEAVELFGQKNLGNWVKTITWSWHQLEQVINHVFGKWRGKIFHSSLKNLNVFTVKVSHLEKELQPSGDESCINTTPRPPNGRLSGICEIDSGVTFPSNLPLRTVVCVCVCRFRKYFYKGIELNEKLCQLGLLLAVGPLRKTRAFKGLKTLYSEVHRHRTARLAHSGELVTWNIACVPPLEGVRGSSFVAFVRHMMYLFSLLVPFTPLGPWLMYWVGPPDSS